MRARVRPATNAATVLRMSATKPWRSVRRSARQDRNRRVARREMAITAHSWARPYGRVGDRTCAADPDGPWPVWPARKARTTLLRSPSRGSRTARTPIPRDRRSARTAAGSARRSRSSSPPRRAYFGRVHESRISREFRPIVIMMWAAAYGPTPGNARSVRSSSASGSSSRRGCRQRLQVELAVGDRAGERTDVRAPIAGADHVSIERLAGAGHARRASGTRW